MTLALVNLFHIKCEVSTKQLSVTDSVERRDWHTRIELTFCVLTLYIGPSGECIILIFYSFLMFLTYLVSYSMFITFFTTVLSEMIDKFFTLFVHRRGKQLTGLGVEHIKCTI